MSRNRCATMKPFYVMEVLEKCQTLACQGEDVIHMEIGEPDFDTPDCIKEAACKAVTDGHTHYTHSQGIIELREAICRHYANTYGVEIHPDQIIVTAGTSPGMFLVFSALLAMGEEVVVSDPHYACYLNFVRFVGGVPVCVSTREEDGFQYRPEDAAAYLTEKTRAILINSPSNPVGTLLSDDRMQAMADLRAHSDEHPWILSDEIYHGLVYEGRERSILEFTDRAFVFNGFSKAYAMTGWRLGYIIAPRQFIPTLRILHQNFFISANSVAQWAGIAALESAGPDVARMRSIYDRRRKFMISRLRELGLGVAVEPTGAFYILANARHLGQDSLKLAFDILEKARIGVAPGIDFGSNAEGFLRFSYANSLDKLEEGMFRLEKYIDQIKCA
ncbi:Aspartate/methionine/tyrosine aminotransferase [Desulfonatronum thiosulfatophilum]|uniref:Aminotransferase n=1 Tax=Desulfonatronum thiosulfatophilum TaxID=617002 RepID=A0A1G6BYP1_9BACT|nr:pyridoxal phosphate-dependent aminotransferase [Desulfonatronum thiosulfatophilum]SDB25751.1 Aspartate/methionine/tyrosine aminotransferase [Desulfonatronum thiosulfatophilum]